MGGGVIPSCLKNSLYVPFFTILVKILYGSFASQEVVENRKQKGCPQKKRDSKKITNDYLSRARMNVRLDGNCQND
jgi:hypothetical protein